MCNTLVDNDIRKSVCGTRNRCEVFRGVFTEFDLISSSKHPSPGGEEELRFLTCVDCDAADAVYTLLKKR